jgi:branched-chain amino acid transport system substrate-binding protein
LLTMVMVAGMLAGCAPAAAPTAVPPTKAPPTAVPVPPTPVPPKILTGKAISIAYSVNLSGSPLGAQMHCNAIQMRIKEFNDAGGVDGRPVIVNCMDDGGDPKQGVLIAQKVCDNADFLGMIGPWWSGVTLAVMPITEKCGMPMLSHGTSPKIPETIAAEGYKHSFQAQPHDAIKGAGQVDVMKYAGIKSTAIVHNKTQWGERLAVEMQKRCNEVGIKVTSFQGIDDTTQDFAPILTKIKGEDPDALVACVYTPKSSIAIQMQDQKMRQVYVCPEAHSAAFLDELGGIGVGTMTYMGADWSIPRVNAWARKYESLYKQPGELTGDAVAAYDEAGIMTEAIVRAFKETGQITRQSITDALWKTDYSGTQWPKVTFKPDGSAYPGWEWFYKVIKGADGKLSFEYMGEWNRETGFKPK